MQFNILALDVQRWPVLLNIKSSSALQDHKGYGIHLAPTLVTIYMSDVSYLVNMVMFFHSKKWNCSSMFPEVNK
jgi:hypothetical protein